MSSALPVGSGSLRSLPLVRGLPLVGVVPALLDHPIQRLLKARDRYGDIFSLDLGVTRWAVLCHPRYAEHVLVTHADRYRKGGPVWEAAAPLLGLPWWAGTVAGTAAMFLVGGGILVHGVPPLHHAIEHFFLPMGALLQAVGPTLADAVLGVLAGALVLAGVTAVQRLRGAGA